MSIPLHSFMFLALLAGLVSCERPRWSVCSQYYLDNCKNGIAADDGTFADLKPVGVSVSGLFIFTVGHPNEATLAEFVFQKEVGDYTLLTETSGKITNLKRTGDLDYRTPALTLFQELELINDGANRIYETIGTVDNCMSGNWTYKSLVINGAERWEIIARDGSSVCIQVEDSYSMVPGIVKDTRALGLDHEPSNICAVVRGCSQPPSQVILIANNVTQGILRREPSLKHK